MPGLRRLTKCKGCGKEIGFIKTINGKSIPVDPQRIAFVPETAYDKFVTDEGEVLTGGEMSRKNQGFRPVEYGYRSHFATCPAADTFRRKNKSERVKEND